MDYSILIPHLNNDLGRRTLSVFLDNLVRHTSLDYELIIQAHQGNNGYILWNQMAKQASTDWLMFTCTDQYVCHDWDIPMWEARAEDMLVVSGLVESGIHPVAEQNLEKNFGGTPETYDEDGFNFYATTKPELPTMESWVTPWLVHKQAFLDTGGFYEDRIAGDVMFFQKWALAGKRWKRVKSYSYHLMSWHLTGAQR